MLKNIFRDLLKDLIRFSKLIDAREDEDHWLIYSCSDILIRMPFVNEKLFIVKIESHRPSAVKPNNTSHAHPERNVKSTVV